MSICKLIHIPVTVVLRTFVHVVETVVRIVCEFVSRVVRTVKTIVERLCGFLPWPLSELCKLVSKVIEVVETVWDFICREVLERVVRIIEALVEYTLYVLRWLCWVIDWPFRGVGLLFCAFGVRTPKTIPVCVKIITDAAGASGHTLAGIGALIAGANAIFGSCGVTIRVAGIQFIPRPEFLTSTTCDPSGMFSSFFIFFSRNADPDCLTIYFVDSIVGARGCAYPGTDWVTIAVGAAGCTIAQEIGHLADHFTHADTPGTFMSTPCGNGTTPLQCCLVATSRFAELASLPKITMPRIP